VFALFPREGSDMNVSHRGIDEPFWRAADIAPVLIWMSDADKRCIYVNKPWVAFTGRTPESELGYGWRDRVHPDDLSKYLDALTAAYERRTPFKVEYRLRRHDGEYRWMLDSGIPQLASDGSLTGYVGSCADITDLKHAQAELVDAQRLAGIGSWQWDRDTGVVVWSKELYRIAGLEPGSASIDALRHPLRARHPDAERRRFTPMGHGAWRSAA
jgi:PAS domain S-box-containing protein